MRARAYVKLATIQGCITCEMATERREDMAVSEQFDGGIETPQEESGIIDAAEDRQEAIEPADGSEIEEEYVPALVLGDENVWHQDSSLSKQPQDTTKVHRNGNEG